MARMISFVVDGTKYEQSVELPDVPKFDDIPAALAYANNDSAKILSFIQAGMKALLVGEARKAVKQSWLAANDPNRAAAVKLASLIFGAWTNAKFGATMTRKAFKAAHGVERTTKAWSSALREARKRLGTESVDLEG